MRPKVVLLMSVFGLAKFGRFSTIDGIDPELELLSFADADALDEVDVEANLSRPFEIAGTHAAERPWRSGSQQ